MLLPRCPLPPPQLPPPQVTQTLCHSKGLQALAYVYLIAQVYAPTFPGYGRSEKQSLAYSQELWRDFLRDFVLEVVQRPVVVAGNSIGGFISASLAADYPRLVKGVLHRIETYSITQLGVSERVAWVQPVHVILLLSASCGDIRLTSLDNLAVSKHDICSKPFRW